MKLFIEDFTLLNILTISHFSVVSKAQNLCNLWPNPNYISFLSWLFHRNVNTNTGETDIKINLLSRRGLFFISTRGTTAKFCTVDVNVVLARYYNRICRQMRDTLYCSIFPAGGRISVEISSNNIVLTSLTTSSDAADLLP